MTLRYLDKDAIKRELSLSYVAAELGITLDAAGRGVCPFHDDHDPSFTIWTDDAGVERWGCFPCGAGGDVFDLLRRAEGLSFPDALRRAEVLLDGQPAGAARPENQPPRREFDPAACAAYVEDGWRQAAGNLGWVAVAAGICDQHQPADYRAAVDRFLLDAWRWGVDSAGNILLPHFDVTGALTGVKIRGLDGHKWSYQGSTYPALYGAWRARRYRDVLLCEGESDAVYATLQDPRVDVLALSGGAGKFNDAWANLEADTYYLAFDADEAGTRATRFWLETLEGRDVRVCRLPRGHDVRSARPAIDAMLASAVKPQPAPTQIIVQDGRFERVTANGDRPLGSWYVEPVARLEGGHGAEPALEVDVHANGQVTRDVLAMSDLHAAGRLRAWAATRSLDCMANDSDTQQLGSYLLARAALLPEVFQTSRVGAHPAPARYRYAGRTVVTPTGSIGRLPWRYVGPAEARGHVHLDDAAGVRWDWLRSLLRMNDTDVVTPLLAWLVAATRRDEVTHFPLLFLGGSSGSGKTTTARLATQLVGSTLTVSLASVTQFALIRALSSSTTVPVFVDEWSLQSRVDARETLQAVVPTLYEGGVTSRGRADLSVVEFQLSAPVMLAGEDSFHLDREAERMVALRLRRDGQRYPALASVMGQPIERIGHWLYRWLLDAEDLPLMPRPGASRPEYNRAVLEAGWATLGAFLAAAAEHDDNVPELPALDLGQLDAPEAREHENEYEAFLREGLALRDGDGIPLVWPDERGRGTYARFRMLTSATNMSRVDVELPGRSRAMKQYFADKYTLSDERVQTLFADRPVRATLIEGFHAADDPS